MSQYYGDIALGDTIQWLFTTVDGAGLPTILTGSPTATAYTDGGVTQSATGVTLTANFDGVTGLNLMSVVASGGNGFAVDENIEIVLDAGTVDGNTVVGYAVGSFSIEGRSALRPTTAGNTLDVNATGEAGLDLDNTSGTIDAAQLGADAITNAKIAPAAITPTEASVNMTQINGDAQAAANLEGATEVIVLATVETGTTAASTTSFSVSDITEATADHYVGRTVLFRTGPLTNQATDITGYSLISGEGNFVVDLMTDTPLDGNLCVII